MAAEGLIPYCAIYSTFLQRGYDQVIHDVALQNLPVIFCLDRAGLVGHDGPTHHGVFDLAYLRCIPNMTLCSPMDEIELRNLLFTAQLGLEQPIAIRYPRGKGVTVDWKQPFEKLKFGTGRTLKEGSKVAVLTLGPIGNGIAQTISANDPNQKIGHYDMRFVKPLDKELLDGIFNKYEHIVTVEDGTKHGGFGSAILEYANEKGYSKPITLFGIKDEFIEHGPTIELQKIAGIDLHSIKEYLVTHLD